VDFPGKLLTVGEFLLGEIGSEMPLSLIDAFCWYLELGELRLTLAETDPRAASM